MSGFRGFPPEFFAGLEKNSSKAYGCGSPEGNNHQIDRIHAEANARTVEGTILLDFVHVLEYTCSSTCGEQRGASRTKVTRPPKPGSTTRPEPYWTDAPAPSPPTSSPPACPAGTPGRRGAS